jgi:hypothetical protein
MANFAIMRQQEFQFSSADMLDADTTIRQQRKRGICTTNKSVISKFRTGVTMGIYVVCEVNTRHENCWDHKMVMCTI